MLAGWRLLRYHKGMNNEPGIACKTKLTEVNGWLIAWLPVDASRQLPSRGQVIVKGSIDSYNFQTALEPDGNGSHWLHVTPHIQSAIKKDAGDNVTLTIQATKDWPEPAVPKDIQAGLVSDPRMSPLWAKITPLARWEWIRWINATANPATRAKRIDVAGSKMRAGERRPCCFNRSMCCVPEVSKNGVLIGALQGTLS